MRKADDVPDQLAELLDPLAATAIREWAQGRGGTIELPSQRWQASGRTGAPLTAILLVLPGPRGGRTEHKQIVKVLPAGMGQEAGFHEQALRSNRTFAEKYFIRQTGSRYPVGDGRFLLFQEIAGDLVDYRPLENLPNELRGDFCATVARLMMHTWQGDEWPENLETTRTIVTDYLRWELRTPIDTIETWAAEQDLATPDQEVITSRGEVLPNPIQMVLDGLSVRRVILHCRVGFSHGDLHLGNVLAPHREPSTGIPVPSWSPDDIRIVDLAGFNSAAPLSRDLVTLSLSVAAAEYRRAHSTDDTNALLGALLEGGGPPSSRAVTGSTATLSAVLGAAASVPGSWRDDWRAQYLLSLLAGALAHTTYENAGIPGRRWFFHLAARAAAEFVSLAERTNMIPAEPDPADRPDQILVSIVHADTDHDEAQRLRDRLVAHATDRLPWTVGFHLRSPDVLIILMSFTSIVDPGCLSEIAKATSGRVPVVPVRTDSTVPPTDDQQAGSLIDLIQDDAAGFTELTGRIAAVASPGQVQQRIRAEVRRTAEEEARAEGARRRRLGFFRRERHVRLEDERRRASSAGHPDALEPRGYIDAVVTVRNVRLVNDAPDVPDAKFHDRVNEMKQVDDAIVDVSVRLIAVAGDVGSGKTAFAAELRRRLASGKAAVAPDAVVYLTADGYRPITVATILSDLARSVADEDRRLALARRLADPIEWPEKLTEVLAALGSSKVVVILDAAEHLLNPSGDFRDQELPRLLRSLASRPGHASTLVMTVANGPMRQLRGEPDPPVRLVRLGRGLPFDDAMDFLDGLDRTATLGTAEMADRDRQRVQAISVGHPRTLELFFGVLRRQPARTAPDLIAELEDVGPDATAKTLFGWMFARLDRTEQRVVQALAVYGRPVMPNAVDHLLMPFVPGVSSDPVLRSLYDSRVVRRDRGHYFMTREEGSQVLESMPFGELDDYQREPRPPFTRLSLWRRAATFFEQHRADTITGLQDLRPIFSEIELRILAWDYYPALSLMKYLDDHHLRDWGQSDALVEWRRDIRGKLYDPRWEAHNRNYLVAALQQQEDTEAVIEELRRARARLGRYRLSKDHIRLGLEMANARFESGDISHAERRFRRCLWLCRLAGGMQSERMVAQLNLAICQAKTGKFSQALRNFETIMRSGHDLSDVEQKAWTPTLLVNYGWALGQIGQTTRALELLRSGRSQASATMNSIGVGLCQNGEAAVLIDLGRSADAIGPAEAAAKIATRTRDPGLVRQANLNLGLAQLCLGRLRDAYATAQVSARIDRGPRAVGACGLLGIAAFRLSDFTNARTAFLNAGRIAGEQVGREPRDYQAWDAKGIAYFGLAVLELDQRSYFLKEAGLAFSRARKITLATGVVKRNLVLLSCFDAYPDLTLAMSKVASGGNSTFG